MSKHAGNGTAHDGPPNAPDYRALRMSAEWAGAIRGRPLHFEYSADTGRMVLADTAATHPVTTPPNADRPRIDRVEMRIGDAVLPLDPDRFCALAWSESSVEKFFFSYYASAASDDGARFLDRLFNAWYGYPGRVVQVYALAFRYGAGDPWGPLSLDATVGLVCRGRNGAAPEILGLDEFERRYPTGGPRGPQPVRKAGRASRFAGWKVGRTLDSIVLREAAEFVSGMRGRYVWLTLVNDELTPWVCPTESPGRRPRGVWIAEGVAAAVRADRPAPEEVVLVVNGIRHPLLSPDEDRVTARDAVFWTDGAVEALLLPYYASVKGRLAPFFGTVLMGKWNGLIPPDSNDPECAVTALRGLMPGAGRSVDGGPGPSSVYAVTHLPRSEYVTDGTAPTAALEHRTRLLAPDGSGGFVEHPVFGASAAPPPA